MIRNKMIPIDSKAFYRNVAALVIPMALQNLINVGVQSADVIMLGRVNELQLSSAALAGQVQFVMLLIFFGLSSGASVLTAQYWGKGDMRTIEKVIAMTLRISFAVAVVFALAALLIPEQLMRIFTPDPVVIEGGIRYLHFIAPSYLCMAFTNIYLNLMRSVERVVISTVIYSISFVVNVILNAILIFGLFGAPRMEVAGAALATTLARVLELAITMFYAYKFSIVRLKRKDFFKRHKLLNQDFKRYALPTTLNELFWGTGISANAVIIGHLGSAVVAANSVGQVTRQLATVVSFGIANATAIMVGKALGGGEIEKAQAYASRFNILAIATGIAGGTLILSIRPLIPRIVSLTPQAEEYLSFLLVCMSVYVLFQAFVATLIVGTFRGGGDTRFGLILDIASMWCFSIPLAAVAAFIFKWPPQVVFLFILSDEIVKAPFAIMRYKSKIWLRNVTR